MELALSGSGNVAPNPLVGSVLVRNNEIVAEGYHTHFGGAHAEVNAISKVRDQTVLKECTLYVNLEPCSHFGKTPPCSSLIIEKEIPIVVISNKDPNPVVDGSGITKLRSAGIEVMVGVLEAEGLELNKRFFTSQIHKRPYIILKWAQSTDGFLAPENNSGITWISNPSSRLLVHKWRGEEQAILIGRNTALNDNPRLNVRGFKSTDPIRILIDPMLDLPSSLHVFNDRAKTIIFNHSKNYTSGNLEYVKVPSGKNFISSLINELFLRSVQSLIVEGGAITLRSFIAEGMWDEMRVFTGNLSFEKGIKAPQLPMIPSEKLCIDTDLLTIYRNINPA